MAGSLVNKPRVTQLRFPAGSTPGQAPIVDVDGTSVVVGTPDPAAHTHAEADVTDLVPDLAAKQSISEKGQPSGYAALDATGKVPSSQLPASASATAPLLSDDRSGTAVANDAGDDWLFPG